MKTIPLPAIVRAPLCCALALPLIAAVPAIAQDSPPDKTAYTLFNPTPDNLLRDLSTDRPDATESPYTVDAGRVQIELSFFDVSIDRWNDAGEDVTTLAVSPLLIKLGLTHNMDLQLGLDPLISQRTRDPGTDTTSTINGAGDLYARLKINLWGNDDDTPGATALGIMPFVVLPTGADDLGVEEIEGGIILPFAMNLADNLDFGAMAELDFVHDPVDDDYDLDFVHTATLSTELLTDIGGFIEYAGAAALSGDRDYRASVNTGFTYAINANTQLDCGIRAGLTEDAEDFGVFAGISLRF